MSKNLVFNPCLQIHRVPDAVDEYLVTSPVPGQGLKRLNVSKSKHPETYGTIEEFTKVGTNLFDPNADLDEKSKTIFESAGVLIEETALPTLPLFACQLNEIPPADFRDATELRVNKSLLFEPVDFTGLHDKMVRRHLLPTQPVAWIRHRSTGIEYGFWLTPEQAELIKQLDPGEIFDVSKIPDVSIRLLFAAGIVGTDDEFRAEEAEWKNIIRRAANEFRELGYTVIPNLLPPFYLDALRKFYSKYVAEGFMEFGDNQVDKRYWQLNEPFANSLNVYMTELMEAVAAEKVRPSYCFAASYIEGAELEPHVDREQCEFSVSLQVDFQPGASDRLSPWALSLFRPPAGARWNDLFGWDAIEAGGPTIDQKDLYLKNGDGLFYRGRELVHYRRPLDAGCTSTSIFLHYVRQNFEGNLY